MAVCCCGPFLKGDAAFPNLLKNSEFRLSFPAPAKNLVCLNLLAGKGKNSRKSALHYLRFRFGYIGATGFVLSPHSVLLLAQRADVIEVSLLNIASQ